MSALEHGDIGTESGAFVDIDRPRPRGAAARAVGSFRPREFAPKRVTSVCSHVILLRGVSRTRPLVLRRAKRSGVRRRRLRLVVGCPRARAGLFGFIAIVALGWSIQLVDDMVGRKLPRRRKRPVSESPRRSERHSAYGHALRRRAG